MQEFKDFKNEVFDQMVDSLDDMFEDHVILKHTKVGLNTKILSVYKEDGFIRERIFNEKDDGVALAFMVPYKDLDDYFETMDEIYSNLNISYEIIKITYDEDQNKRVYSIKVEV